MKQKKPVSSGARRVLVTLLFTLIVFTVMINVSCCNSPEPAKSAGIVRDDFEYPGRYLDWCMTEAMARFNIPGAAVVVASRDRVLFQKAYGFSDTQTKTPVTLDTIFRAGSITKTMTAFAVMKLAEEGKLDIDAPVSKIVPEFSIQSHSPAGPAITVRHLLSHYSGIQNDYLAGIMGESRYSNAELIAALKDTWTCFPAGEVYYYSNTGYSILQAVIERTSGKSFDDYMAQAILGPLGMGKSSFGLTESQKPLLAVGHMKSSLGMLPGGAKSDVQVPFLEIRDRAAGGLLTSARDFVPYLQYLVSPKDRGPARIVGQKSFDLMTTKQFPEASRRVLVTSDYGLGIMLNKLPLPGITDIYAHSANVNGFYSFLIFSPSQDLAMAIFTNSNDGYFASYSIMSRAFRRYLEARQGHELVPQLPLKREVSLTREKLRVYEGDYALLGLCAKITAGESRLELSMKGLDQKVELIPAGEHLFKPVGRFLCFDVDLAGLLGLDNLFVRFKFDGKEASRANLPVQMDLVGVAGEGLVELSLLRAEIPEGTGALAHYCSRYALDGRASEATSRTMAALGLYIPVKEFRVFILDNRIYLGSDELPVKLGMLLIPVSESSAVLAGTGETVLFGRDTLSFSGITLTRKGD